MSRRKTKQKGFASISKKATAIKETSAGLMPWLIVLSIILPLIYSSTTLDPVVSVRYLVYCIFITLFLFYFLLFKLKNYPIPSSPLLLLIFAVGLTYCIDSSLALAFAINKKEGFVETSRGFMNLLFLAIVLVIVFYDAGKLNTLFRTFIVLAFVHSLIGIFQYYEIAFTGLPGNFPPYGLMANRNLYGSAQALLLPFCLYILFLDNKTWKYLSAFTLVFLFISVLLSQTRSAWLASFLIISGSLLLVLLFVPKLRRLWLIGTVALIATITLLTLVFVFAVKDKTLAQSIKERSSSIARPLSTDDTTAAVNNINERVVIWNKTLQLIKDHQATGVGPANWKIGIQAYGNKGLINEYGNYVLDHAHNIYLQLAAETGIPGLLLFSLFLLLIFFVAFKALRSPNANEKEKVLVILALCGMAAFLLDGLFSFPLERIEHTFYLFLFAGIILGIYALIVKEKQLVLSTRKWLWSSLAISAFGLFIGKEKYNFEIHAYRTKAFNKTNNYQNVINEVEESKTGFASLDINGDPLQMYSAIAYKGLKNYDPALRECLIALRCHPYSARVYNTLGTIYTETQNFPKAIDAYKKSLDITPKFDVTLKNLAVSYYNVKQYRKCLEVLAQIKDAEKEPVLIELKNACMQFIKQE